MRVRVPASPARPGFTLVELLVAAALSVLVLLIISEAFATATATFSNLKSIGGLSDSLRNVQLTVTTDLDAAADNGGTMRVPHLTINPANDPVSVSSFRSAHPWAVGQTTPTVIPAGRGYVKVHAPVVVPLPTTGTGAYVYEGSEVELEGDSTTDPSAATLDDSVRATDHWFAFTNWSKARYRATIFPKPSTADNPGFAELRSKSLDTPADTVFTGEWAEVCYFLQKNGLKTNPAAGGTALDLFTLYRQVRVMPADATSPPSIPDQPVDTITQDPYWGQIRTIKVGTTADQVADPQRIAPSANRTYSSGLAVDRPLPFASRVKPATATDPQESIRARYYEPDFASDPPKQRFTQELRGVDLLAMNVVSMRVRTLFLEFPAPLSPTSVPSGAPFYRDVSWDTGDATTARPFGAVIPNPAPPAAATSYFVPQAIQIKLRVYDPKNGVSRQMTIVRPI